MRVLNARRPDLDNTCVSGVVVDNWDGSGVLAFRGRTGVAVLDSQGISGIRIVFD